MSQQANNSRLLAVMNSTIGLKLAMATTGFVLVGFVVAHMVGNLQIYLGPTVFNDYAQMMQSTKLVWVLRLIMLGAIAGHVASGARLTLRNAESRENEYEASLRSQTSSAAGKLMMHTGIILLIFILVHLGHFTLGLVQPENFQFQEMLQGNLWVPVPEGFDTSTLAATELRHDAFAMFVRGFSSPAMALFYIICNCAVMFHLYHAVASMFATLGLSNRDTRGLFKLVGIKIAVLVLLGNISFPIAVQLGFVHL